LVDFELAPDAKSSLSISRLFNPRLAPSSNTPVPLQPPPMTTTSYYGFLSI